MVKSPKTMWIFAFALALVILALLDVNCRPAMQLYQFLTFDSDVSLCKEAVQCHLQNISNHSAILVEVINCTAIANQHSMICLFSITYNYGFCDFHGSEPWRCIWNDTTQEIKVQQGNKDD